MYSIAKGTKTVRVMTSWMILSCGRDNVTYPIRFAGTWNRYSHRAITQLTSAAIIHGLCAKSRKCAYHANVMNVFDTTRRATVT
jgi:hypothetical protein